MCTLAKLKNQFGFQNVPRDGGPLSRIRMILCAFCTSLVLMLCALPSLAETPLVSGNGHGFIVYSHADGHLTRFYAHPYKFEKPDPKDPLSEGIETVNFIKSVGWNLMNEPAPETPVSGDLPSTNTALQLKPQGTLVSLETPPVVKSGPPPVAEYLKQSQIIVSQDSQRKQFFFMPWGIQRNVFVTACQSIKKDADRPSLHIEWAKTLKNEKSETVEGIEIRTAQFAGLKGLVAIVPIGAQSNKGKDCTAAAFVSLEDPKDLADAVKDIKSWEAGLSAQKIIDRELKQLESWRCKPAVHFQNDLERKLWRQSEVVLRMGQILEQNKADRHNHGIILASLPDGAWFTPWVRDMAYAAIALGRMGHKDEARWAVEAYFNAQPVGKLQKETGGTPYQISVVRYFGDGSEQPFFTMEGANNVEFDDWGLALWALGEYCEKYHDDSILDYKTYRGSLYNNARDYVVRPLLANLEPYKGGLIVAADTSIWEERQKDKKHFAFSTIAAIKGLKCFDKIAEKRNDVSLHDELQKKIKLLEKGFNEAFISSGKLKGTLEAGIKNEVDGAFLAAITMGPVKDEMIWRNALDQMQRLKMPSGGYRRVTSTVKDPQIFEYWYERQEFVFINFLMAEVYLKLGMPDKAAELIKPMLDKASEDHFFVPEMYVSEVNYRFTGPVGAPTGAIPMVGYGAGAYAIYLLQRENAHK